MTVRVRTKVLPGNKIEVSSPELAVGSEVDVEISQNPEPRRTFRDIVRDLPPGQLFKTPEEVDEYIRQERDSWER
jgi:hypothetical protein